MHVRGNVKRQQTTRPLSHFPCHRSRLCFFDEKYTVASLSLIFLWFITSNSFFFIIVTTSSYQTKVINNQYKSCGSVLLYMCLCSTYWLYIYTYIYMLSSKTMKRDQNNYMSYEYVAARRWVCLKICCIINRKTQT